MIPGAEPYPSGRGVEAAIKEAARKAARADPSLDVTKRIHLEYFNRFLCRVFSEGEESEWVLKGATSILARISSTRSTRDIDLYRQGITIEKALEDLRRLASIDLRDHFRFEYAGHEAVIATDAQPYTDGYRVSFNVFIGVARRGSVQVDLVVGGAVTDDVQTLRPAVALDLPRLANYQYRLYPVVDQIADKVCATMFDHGGRPSSRQKDLVDIVVFAATQNIRGDALRLAIETERQRRGMAPLDRFSVPAEWGSGYAKLSKPVPHCADYPTVELAAELASRLIDPVLAGEVHGREWSADELKWN